MEKWQSNLHDFLTANNFHPYEKWNQALQEWCSEFAGCLENFSGIRAKCSFSQYKGTTEMEIGLREYKPFRAVVSFAPSVEGAFSLCLKYTTGFDFGKEIRQIWKRQQGSVDCYQWEEEQLAEIEIREKAYFMQLLTNRLECFIQWRKSLNTEGIDYR